MNLSLNKYYSEKKDKSNLVKTNVQNLNNIVRDLLLFCDNMTDMQLEEPTDILAWKNSLELMANDAISKLLSASMEKGLIKNEKELTVTFVRD